MRARANQGEGRGAATSVIKYTVTKIANSALFRSLARLAEVPNRRVGGDVGAALLVADAPVLEIAAVGGALRCGVLIIGPLTE